MGAGKAFKKLRLVRLIPEISWKIGINFPPEISELTSLVTVYVPLASDVNKTSGHKTKAKTKTLTFKTKISTLKTKTKTTTLETKMTQDTTYQTFVLLLWVVCKNSLLTVYVTMMQYPNSGIQYKKFHTYAAINCSTVTSWKLACHGNTFLCSYVSKFQDKTSQTKTKTSTLKT